MSAPDQTYRLNMPKQLPDFSTARVLIAGDVMLDRYWLGPTSRVSVEAPVLVVKVEQDKAEPGAAGNVAVNVASLGAKAHLVGLVGEDDAATQLESRLSDFRVNCHLARVKSRPTITKLRIVSRHQQLIRLDFEDPFTPEQCAPLTAIFDGQLENVGATVISDSAKGTLHHVTRMIARARARNLPVVVDPKGPDLTRYRGATAMTLRLSEFEAAVGTCSDDVTLSSRARALRDELNLNALIITRSEQGMTLITRDAPPQPIPTRAREFCDATGAGDTVVAMLGAALASASTMLDAVSLANLAAGIVVGKLGTASVTLPELQEAMAQYGPTHGNT